MGANKSQNEAQTVLGTSLIGLARTVDGELAAAEAEVERLRARAQELEAEVERLTAEVERLRALLPPEKLLERARAGLAGLDDEMDYRHFDLTARRALSDLLAHFEQSAPEEAEPRSACSRLSAPFSVTAADYPYHVGDGEDDQPAATPEEREAVPTDVRQFRLVVDGMGAEEGQFAILVAVRGQDAPLLATCIQPLAAEVADKESEGGE